MQKASELRCAYTGHAQGFNIGSVSCADTYYRYIHFWTAAFSSHWCFTM